MIQVLMVALAEFITKMDFFCGHLNITRPLFGGFFCGLLLGDVKTGIIMGITLELIFIGSFSVGSATSPDMSTAAVLCTAFAICNNLSIEAAVVLAVPLALLGGVIKTVMYGVIFPFFDEIAQRKAEEGDFKAIERIYYLTSLVIQVGGFTLITALVFWAGQGAVETIVNAIPAVITEALPKATGMMPALGFALLLRMLITKELAPFAFIGFLLVAYLKIPTMGIALIGLMIGLVMATIKFGNAGNAATVTETGGADDDF